MIAALAEQRRHQCPCGAATEHSYSLCRKCHARMVWRRKTTRTGRRAARRLAARQAREGARILAQAMSLLHAVSKGVES
jgi:hypothetical protein